MAWASYLKTCRRQWVVMPLLLVGGCLRLAELAALRRCLSNGWTGLHEKLVGQDLENQPIMLHPALPLGRQRWWICTLRTDPWSADFGVADFRALNDRVDLARTVRKHFAPKTTRLHFNSIANL
jgi:hypothetical protein